MSAGVGCADRCVSVWQCTQLLHGTCMVTFIMIEMKVTIAHSSVIPIRTCGAANVTGTEATA